MTTQWRCRATVDVDDAAGHADHPAGLADERALRRRHATAEHGRPRFQHRYGRQQRERRPRPHRHGPDRLLVALGGSLAVAGNALRAWASHRLAEADGDTEPSTESATAAERPPSSWLTRGRGTTT